MNHHWPEILLGGRAVLFTIIPAGPVENAQIAVLDLETGAQTVLVRGGSNPRYSPTGHLVYGAGGTLRAVGFDLDRLAVTTNTLPVLDGVITKGSGAGELQLFSRRHARVCAGHWWHRERPAAHPGLGRSGGREEPLALDPGGYDCRVCHPMGPAWLLTCRVRRAPTCGPRRGARDPQHLDPRSRSGPAPAVDPGWRAGGV